MLEGHFARCDICNNGLNLLNKFGKKLSLDQRRCVLRYIKLHRNQQKEERAFALGQIQEARDQVVDELSRQPKKAHLLIDAWTSSNGDSPKVFFFIRLHPSPVLSEYCISALATSLQRSRANSNIPLLPSQPLFQGNSGWVFSPSGLSR